MTRPSAAPARSGRPPRETTAPTPPSGSAAAFSAAAAPVDAPKQASGRPGEGVPAVRPAGRVEQPPRSAARCRRRCGGRRPRRSSGDRRAGSRSRAPRGSGRRSCCAGCSGSSRCRGRRRRGRLGSGGRPTAPPRTAPSAVGIATSPARSAAVSPPWTCSRAASSSSTTSSSLVCEKSSYQEPTLLKCCGAARLTTSSTSPSIRSAVPAGQTGTARITRAAPCALRTWEAADAVTPVAMPSSTTITVRPRISAGGVSPR